MASSRDRPARTLRIIAGRWRGRRFRFPPTQIRPTPDRVRETLFNWLSSRIEGARCLDLFAGSGALGLEALSRGAAEVTFVEHDRTAAAAIEQLLREWQGAGGRVRCTEARQFLGTGPAVPCEVVFLDPPFAAGLLDDCVRLLKGGWLTPGALVYVEHARRDAPPKVPAAWEALRTGSAGEVRYHLYRAGEAPPAGRGAST